MRQGGLPGAVIHVDGLPTGTTRAEAAHRQCE